MRFSSRFLETFLDCIEEEFHTLSIRMTEEGEDPASSPLVTTLQEEACFLWQVVDDLEAGTLPVAKAKSLFDSSVERIDNARTQDEYWLNN